MDDHKDRHVYAQKLSRIQEGLNDVVEFCAYPEAINHLAQNKDQTESFNDEKVVETDRQKVVIDVSLPSEPAVYLVWINVEFVSVLYFVNERSCLENDDHDINEVFIYRAQTQKLCN